MRSLAALTKATVLPSALMTGVPGPPLPPPVPPTPAAPPSGARRSEHYARRRRDPLGEGQPGTWRLLLIKVAAEVVASCRRVVVRLSGTWPYLDYYRQVSRAVAGVPESGVT
jgi:hypothetical protein